MAVRSGRFPPPQYRIQRLAFLMDTDSVLYEVGTNFVCVLQSQSFVAFMVDIVELGQVLLRVSVFSCHYHSSNAPHHIHLQIYSSETDKCLKTGDLLEIWEYQYRK